MQKKTIYNKEIIYRLIEKYGVSQRFITMSLRGDRTSETSDSIKKDYFSMEKALKKTLKSL